MLDEKFIVHNPSAPHKRETLELKNNYAHVIHGPQNATKDLCNAKSQIQKYLN
jgi:hypothetical protein